MVGTRHLIVSLSILILIIAAGTIGYMTIEGWQLGWVLNPQVAGL